LDEFFSILLGLTVAEARLIERIQNDPFFKNINGTTAH
jgi:hypothetical protein